MATATPTSTLGTVTSTPSVITNPSDDNVPAHHASPVVAFIIGLSIILVASILNAGGLNLTKLDHVCCTRNALKDFTDQATYVGAHKRNSQGISKKRLSETV